MLAQPATRNFMGFPPYQDQALDVQSSTEQDQYISQPRPYARSIGTYNTGLTYAQHELLRQRKTPGGRQVETLDIANIDSQLDIPPQKHVLLSLSPGATSNGSIPINQSAFHYHSQASSRQRIRTASQHDQSYNLTTNSSPWNSAGGYDSLLTQDPQFVAHHRHLNNGYSQIPTVLPANLHTSFGPTASAGQQYYGPYWPDGTFSPYRPDPIRDDRYFHWRHSRDLSRGSFSPLENFDGMQSDRLYASNSTVMPTNMVQGVRLMQSLPPRDAAVPYPSFQDRISNVLDSTGFPSTMSNLGQQDVAYTFDRPGLGDRLLPTPASERIMHKDKTFAWAYRAYVELLAQVQRESKAMKQQNAVTGTIKVSPKPAIFPRPPQRTQSHFNCDNQKQKDPMSISISKLQSTVSEDIYQRPLTAINLSRRESGLKGSSHIPSQANNIAQGQPKSVLYSSQLTKSSDFSFSSGTDIPTPAECYANARHALSVVEALCYGVDGPCTDGMLLAGCLAYGIGNYEKALSWYQKILKQDSKHVEAMSNIAATLLALGNREEAVSYWTTAIKLRPSYFEAVEHLVGLFVSSQRPKEAVSMISYIETCLKPSSLHISDSLETAFEDDSDSQSRTSSATVSSTDGPYHELDFGRRYSRSSNASEQLSAFGNSRYAIPAADNGRLLALIHAKANMLYSMNKNTEAASAFENAILVATGDHKLGIKGLINKILRSCISAVDPYTASRLLESKEPILLSPERAQQIVYRMFSPSGNLPGLEFVPTALAHRAAISTTSNCLLSLAKIYQDGLSVQSADKSSQSPGTREILALYYLSLSLQPSPSTANNVGILLASVHSTIVQVLPQQTHNKILNYTGVAPGSGVALALAYYNYGLNLDGKHAHLYTNLGSLLKDLGELQAAVKMYETAVECDGNFDIALANLANAVKDQGRIGEAIKYYKRAVQANPEFAEAVCGLATALNSVCNWYGRGGVYADGGKRDRIHVDEQGMMYEAKKGSGWLNKVVEIVDRQLREGESWGIGILNNSNIELLCRQLTLINSDLPKDKQLLRYRHIQQNLQAWAGQRWEGSRVVRLLERAVRYISWQWYQDRYKHRKEYPLRRYQRPTIPSNVPVPNAPTVLPFHTFTTPLSAKQVRRISQRNALRISVSTFKASWLPRTVYPPPAPPKPCLRVGYVSSDFNNHPLAHLMQSIFGMHDQNLVRAYCYATTPSDNSIHRRQIQDEAPVFVEASSWSVERLVNQIVEDGIHILVNLNGYTRGAKNELFAARPAPIHMSFMGFAGTLGAEWCDYVYADAISIPSKTLAPYRYNVDIEDKLNPNALVEDDEDWIYAENVIFSKSSFFCVDHKQSAPDAKEGPPPLHDKEAKEQAWHNEQQRRWKLRKELFPTLSDTAVILGNFNQLYKIDPTTFRMYLRILSAVPNAILWLLRFPDVGEQNLLNFAKTWAGADIVKRIVFTDVAPKGTHIIRASVVDLFLDTPECNAHTTAADVIWSGTPIITWARWDYKMCSRMASSIVASALPEGAEGASGRKDLLVNSEHEYEEHAIQLLSTLAYPIQANGANVGKGHGRLMELRKILWEGRWTSRLFDTQRWVRDLEKAYWKAWNNWEAGIGGDIYL